jgi:hypothetical protein
VRWTYSNHQASTIFPLILALRKRFAGYKDVFLSPLLMLLQLCLKQIKGIKRGLKSEQQL